jgi:hypothetical protein
MVTQTGCDAVMIGRTAPSNPWIFRQIEQYCAAMQDAGAGSAGVGNAHVGTAALGCPAVQSSPAFPDSASAADIRLTREGHDFSRAVNADNLKQALAAGGRFYDSHRSRPLPDDSHLLPDADRRGIADAVERWRSSRRGSRMECRAAQLQEIYRPRAPQKS